MSDSQYVQVRLPVRVVKALEGYQEERNGLSRNKAVKEALLLLFDPTELPRSTMNAALAAVQKVAPGAALIRGEKLSLFAGIGKAKASSDPPSNFGEDEDDESAQAAA